ncbi:SET domain-containing protein 9 isoform X5 [Salmo salar]|uniref:SET domain-containing protein 9 isoform X5 n=1 Tax=Salmo salar TaxID=8030 RepID=A0A1S3KK14_SALSA|nr:SET domain-containing protein 9 isoform X5 [Salmo salar]|eukprot:XP_013979086.1 PREDICTED: SET domain-containing protein 9 isoform X5 [Salmo salar]
MHNVDADGGSVFFQQQLDLRGEPNQHVSLHVQIMFRIVMTRIQDKWKSYRHRFVPWIALNLRKNERTIRQVTERSKDRLASDEVVLETLLHLFRALLRNDVAHQEEVLRLLPASTQTRYLSPETTEGPDIGEPKGEHGPIETMFLTVGFCIERKPSSLPFAGTGVFVTRGFVPKGATVAMYPGTIYQAYEPILFQSIWNPFVFRCIDHVLIDGNDKGISKIVYRSCSGRDRLGPFRLSDITWLTANTENPLAVGQYVNNCSNERAANVCYQEYDVPEAFPLELRQYLPNVNYRHDTQRPLRCVVLVALRDIRPGEELFSNYFTIVH